MQGLAHEDACGSHVHGYRWKKFGMPLRIFHDKHFLLQPLLVMSQVDYCTDLPFISTYTRRHTPPHTWQLASEPVSRQPPLACQLNTY
jgi:hypothetical protein